jgi:1-deoxy-D-xylulose-5-phosphate reductoisomerase
MKASSPAPTGIAILGSTGSIGRQTLDVIRANRDRFTVVALAAGSNCSLLQEQIDEFHPAIVSAMDPDQIRAANDTQIFSEREGLIAAATDPRATVIVVATSGIASIAATLAAASLGKTLALANKEALICAADLLLPLVAKSGSAIHPVDSEHSAVWQCMGSLHREDIASITLTASGGPFRAHSLTELATVSAADALKHPTWSMGKKITIDSATLVNKGLEVIEASRLFGVPLDAIDVVIHPESIVHSLVTFKDGSTLAQLSHPDMRLPIQFALSHPKHLVRDHQTLSLSAIGSLHFDAPDHERFGSLGVCYRAGRKGTAACVALCAADDLLVDAFLANEIRFTEVPHLLSIAIDAAPDGGIQSLDEISNITSTTQELMRSRIPVR